MLRTLLIAMLAACPKAPPAAPGVEAAPEPILGDVIGDWGGSLSAPDAELPVIFHVERDGDTLVASMDSPVQGAFGLPVSRVEATEGGLAMEVELVKGSYEARFVSPDRLDGTWSQNGVSLPLTLHRAAEERAIAPIRPQDPEAPFPYRVVEAEIASVQGVVLSGTLTLPEGDGPFPGAVLISGSGPQDRDEALMGHRPFAVLADHLTRQGIAVLRYDDRGVGASTGDFASAVTPDFADDAAAALSWLAERGDVAGVGYVGHSEGAIVGAIAHETAPASFLVTIGGPAVRGAEVLIEPSAQDQRVSGLPEAEIARSRALQEALMERITSAGPEADTQVLQDELVALLSEALAEQQIPAETLASVAAELLSPWMRWFLSYDPGPALEALQIPVLALYGALDLQVVAEQNAPVARAKLSTGAVEVLEGLNHLLQPAETGAVSEYGQIDVTMDPAAMDRVVAHVLAHGAAP